MVKKRKKTVHRRVSAIPTTNSGIERKLAENTIALQGVLVNLSSKLDELTKKISSLLEIFETSAKALSEKGFKDDKKIIIDQLNKLTDQNKIIAKGLTLLHETNNENTARATMPRQPMQNQQGISQEANFEANQYQRSINSGFKQLPGPAEMPQFNKRNPDEGDLPLN